MTSGRSAEVDVGADAAPVRIRRAVPEDAPVVAAVHLRSSAASRALVPAAPPACATGEDSAKRWRARLADPAVGAAAWVAEDAAGSVVGFCCVGPSPDDGGVGVGHLHALYVLPEAAGRGVGSALLAAGEARLAAAGFAAATLWVLAGNAAARRFYEARGWRPDGAASEDATAGGVAVSVRYRRRLR